MKVLLINPWAVNNDQYYASGFVKGMNEYVELDFAANYFYKGEMPNGEFFSVFFSKSEHMKNGFKRKILRGLEYIDAWKKIIAISKKKKYDVIHVHWLLVYKLDSIFLKKIRHYTNRLVLTAHNVLPHNNGEKFLPDLRMIYKSFDKILVHGNAIRDEFLSYFPEMCEKVFVQYHGEYYQQDTHYEEVEQKDYLIIKAFVNEYERIFIMFGRQFYNKGTDRLIRIWRENFSNEKAGLLIVGRSDSDYPEFNDEISKLESIKNVLVLNHFVDDNALNYAIHSSSIILLPYRHASMSGVIYTAAAFSKPVLCTCSGALAEYLEDKKDSVVCGTDDKELLNAMNTVFEYSTEELCAMGKNLSKNIHEKYDWNVIAKQLVESIYS